MIRPNVDSIAATPFVRSLHVSRRAEPRPAVSDAEKSELSALVVAAAGGSGSAQSALVGRYQRRIAGFVRSIVRQPDGIEDVTQTVFIKMFQRLDRLRDVGAFESWLFMMARTTALDFLRRQQRRIATVSVDESIAEVADIHPRDASAEILDALEVALDELPAQTRVLVSLFVQGNSYNTLAAHAGLTLGAVKARLHRARPHLRACVEAALAGRPSPTALLSCAPRMRVAS